VAYYVLPIATRSPLYSHTLSLLGFWSLIIVYTHIGTHHLLQVAGAHLAQDHFHRRQRRHGDSR